MCDTIVRDKYFDNFMSNKYIIHNNNKYIIHNKFY